jgi:hypothetical protein
MGAFSLCPEDPRSIALLSEMFDELLPHFSSGQFNVGCDETVDLGQGRSKAACEERGKGRVYLDFLLKIHEQVARHGRVMQFWSDIILHYPELLGELPEDIIALIWGYEDDYPYDKNCKKVKESGVDFYVCPGTSSWNTVAGRTHNAMGNLRNAAENGLKYGAKGYLITDWGDRGHWQPLPVSTLGFAYGAAVSWAVDANKDLEMAPVLDRFAFGDRAGIMGQLFFDLGNVYRETGVETSNSSVLWHLLCNPEKSMDDNPFKTLTTDILERTHQRIDDITATLEQAQMDCSDADLIKTEIHYAAGLLRHACNLGIARLNAENGELARVPAEKREELTTELRNIIDLHKKVWLARNRQGGRPDSVGRLESLARRYK